MIILFFFQKKTNNDYVIQGTDFNMILTKNLDIKKSVLGPPSDLQDVIQRSRSPIFYLEFITIIFSMEHT